MRGRSCVHEPQLLLASATTAASLSAKARTDAPWDVAAALEDRDGAPVAVDALDEHLALRDLAGDVRLQHAAAGHVGGAPRGVGGEVLGRAHGVPAAGGQPPVGG